MFSIGKEKAQKLKDWQIEHDKTCPFKEKQGAIGGRTTYEFTPTGLGVIITVSCACGVEIDLTNYKDW